MYCISLFYENGLSSYLSVRDKTEWKTKRTAQKHANDILGAIGKGGVFDNIIAVHIENDDGEIIETFVA